MLFIPKIKNKMLINIEISFDPIITDKEQSLYNIMHNLVQSYRVVNPLIDKLIGTAKGEDRDEYGYYISSFTVIPWIVAIMKHCEETKIMDLGCGMGVLMAQISAYNHEIKTGGIDNEKIFVEIAKILGVRAQQGNLIYLRGDMIKDYSCFYMWEPLRSSGSNDHTKAFVKNLALYTKMGDTIMYMPAGQIGKLIEETKAFDEMRFLNKFKRSNKASCPFRVFRKI